MNADASGNGGGGIPTVPAVFTVHLQSGSILGASPSGRRLLGLSDRDALVGMSISEVLPQLCWPSAGSGWMPVPSGGRSHVEWMCADLPGSDGCGVLTLLPGGVAVLDRCACTALTAYAKGLADGVTAQDLLIQWVGNFVSLLELRSARILHQAATELRELWSAGATAVPQVEHQRSYSLSGTPDEVGPAVRVLRTAVPYEAAVETLKQQGQDADLLDRGAGSIAIWPMDFGRSRYVVEFYGSGAGDLADPVVAVFLRRWMSWLESTLSAHARLADLRLAGEALLAAETPAFITDALGTIVWLNHAFTRCYGRSEQEAIGATPRLIQSGVHGPRYYRALWSALRSGRSWSGETTDRGADGSNVVVRQTITPVRHDGVISNFLSIHSDMTEADEWRVVRERERGVDEITGLLTRSAFLDQAARRLEAARDLRQPVTLLLCVISGARGQVPELDADSRAHVLGQLGQRVRECLDAGVSAGSLADYEFGVLVDAPAGKLRGIIEALGGVVAEPLPLFGDSLKLGLHTSAAEYPTDGLGVEALLLAADRRLADLVPNPAARLMPAAP